MYAYMKLVACTNSGCDTTPFESVSSQSSCAFAFFLASAGSGSASSMKIAISSSTSSEFDPSTSKCRNTTASFDSRVSKSPRGGFEERVSRMPCVNSSMTKESEIGRIARTYSSREITRSPSESICRSITRTSPWTLIGCKPRAKPTSSETLNVPLPSKSMWSNAMCNISRRDLPATLHVGRGARSRALRTSCRTTSLFAVHPRRLHVSK
mmetsp:Transcript_10556/g.39101  ORF Transcript_10556/g.39101 Transcript_10556/m.39101 type:complete len:210 (+) Transcript_10556:3569-4198(+)